MGNGKITKKLKELGLKINGVEPSGETVSEIIDDIEENYNGASKDYVNSLMSGALKRSIVEALPVENIDTNTIYMVLDAQAEEQGNVYNEYLYIENNWELIGTTAPSGTEVIANPTLAGTEDNLTGLEVDGTKYAVPQGGTSLYNILVYASDGQYPLSFTMQVDNAELETYADLKQYLFNKGFTPMSVSGTKRVPYLNINGAINSTYFVGGIANYKGIEPSTQEEFDIIGIRGVDSGGSARATIADDENFSITYLGD